MVMMVVAVGTICQRLRAGDGRGGGGLLGVEAGLVGPAEQLEVSLSPTCI